MAEILKHDFFRRVDESDDELFYQYPRFVVHIDEVAIDDIGCIYATLLPADSAILDLMSSWRSHLPNSLKPKRLVGLGLNRAEMEDNPALTEIVIHNVNREPRLPFPDGSFDAAVMAVSVQYLTRPVELFADVGRILKPRGPLIVAFSNRMFPTKAVALWQVASAQERLEIVTRYFAAPGLFEKINTIDHSRRPGLTGDPVWAVVGYRIGQNAA